MKCARETAEAGASPDSALTCERNWRLARIDLQYIEVIKQTHKLGLSVRECRKLATKDVLDMRKRAIPIRELSCDFLKYDHSCPERKCLISLSHHLLEFTRLVVPFVDKRLHKIRRVYTVRALVFVGDIQPTIEAINVCIRQGVEIAKCMSSRRNGGYLRLIQQIPGNLSCLLLCSCQDRTLLLIHTDLDPGHGVFDRV